LHELTFPHPEPAPQKRAVWPVFLPFAGCPFRCVFCAQDRQTGCGEPGLEAALIEAERGLSEALEQGRGPYELAFFGGTFTALPPEWQARCLALAERFRRAGLVTRVRCSTRPDCVDAAGLTRLRAQGLDLVELGVQSFDDGALKAAGRGYDGRTARAACGLVRAAGLGLGIQLMPGLPGDAPGLFAADAAMAAAFRPDLARLYPCLVIRGTGLAALWERGGYEPWPLDRAVQELAGALPVLWDKGVRVVRLGLAPEGTLTNDILAGPWHPALGQSARGRALLAVVRERVREFGRAVSLLKVPRRYQGELFGHGGELAGEYAALGIGRENVRYVDGGSFRLHG